jgi:TonB family protein
MASSTTKATVAGASGRMLLVAAIHVGAGVMITQGLDLDIGQGQAPPVITATVEKLVPPKIDFAPVAPRISGIIIDDWRLPIPEVDEKTADPNSATIEPFPADGGGAGSAEIAPAPQIVAARSDTRYPLTQPPYPPASIRMGEEGVGVIRVWVLPNGRVGDAVVERSTGSQRLDAAALTEARRWRLRPATRDGVAFADWYSVRVVFRLDQP